MERPDPAKKRLNTYVNWFTKNMMKDGNNPSVGILLCIDQDGHRTLLNILGKTHRGEEKKISVRLYTVMNSAHPNALVHPLKIWQEIFRYLYLPYFLPS